MKWDSATFRVTDPGRYHKTAMIVGAIGLAASVAGYFVDSRQLYFSWLTAYAYWLTLALGGLFFTMLHHLTGSTWSVVLRRLSESVMAVLPFMFIAFLPIIAGLPDLYSWSHADIVAHDELLQGKAAFLNTPFFIIRGIIYFGVWTLLSYLLRKVSFLQDRGDTPELKPKFNRISAPGMIAFAVTVSFASFDWMMSLDAHWYSTIFGVYIFSGATVAVLAFMILVALYLRRRGILSEVISVEHYFDLGKLLFAFLIFWGYMAFSQYLLIWYGNIPEETVWYLDRWQGS